MKRTTLALSLATFASVACTSGPHERTSQGAQAATAYLQLTVNISTSTGNYLVADQGGGADLMAYSTWAKGWETFTLQDLTQSTLTDGDVVTLQGGQGQWASAVNGGGGVITVTAPWQRGWEEFTIHKLNGSGAIGDGDTFALQTSVGGQYVSADDGGGSDVTATAPWARSWETFMLHVAGGSVGTGGGGGGGSGGGGSSSFEQVLSRTLFDAMFPNRSSFYTYDGLVAAAAKYPSFAATGTADDQKRDVAAFLANVAHETGGLYYVEEIQKGPYCDDSASGCPCAPGVEYYGRGPIQLSWNANYCAASQAIFGDPETLRTNPGLVASDASVAWETGLWFWTQAGCESAIVNDQSFGETIQIVNGPVECGGKYPSEVQDRIDYYLSFCKMLGVDPGRGAQGC